MITEMELTEIAARSQAASGSSWSLRRDPQGNPVVHVALDDGGEEVLRVTRDPTPASGADVEFIAHARRDVARLVGAVRGVVELAQDERPKIESRCRGASPGPWMVSLESDRGVGGSNVITVSYDDAQPDLYLWRGGDWSSWERDDLASDGDFEFVASARQDIPKLLDALRVQGT
jgi:hypothetical protein